MAAESVSGLVNESKVCTGCHLLLPVAQFGYHRRATGELHSRCKACLNVQRAAWRHANPDKQRAASAAWRTAHPEQVKTTLAAWRAAHPDWYRLPNANYRSSHPDRQKSDNAAWRAANPGRMRAHKVRRRQRIELADGHYTGAEWEALKARYGYRCLMCGRTEPDIKLTLDHVVPVSKGGTNDISNGQPLCVSCNSRKHTQTLDLRPHEIGQEVAGQ